MHSCVFSCPVSSLLDPSVAEVVLIRRLCVVHGGPHGRAPHEKPDAQCTGFSIVDFTSDVFLPSLFASARQISLYFNRSVHEVWRPQVKVEPKSSKFMRRLISN